MDLRFPTRAEDLEAAEVVAPTESVARRLARRQASMDYHRGWTSRRFDESIRLLAPDLTVGIPINQYPTRESFAQALVSFGGLMERVNLLAQLAHGDEAMLLYDMAVKGLGRMRVAEHFTVKDGRIVRLRQIHDTAAVRAAGLAGDA